MIYTEKHNNNGIGLLEIRSSGNMLEQITEEIAGDWTRTCTLVSWSSVVPSSVVDPGYSGVLMSALTREEYSPYLNSAT